MIRVVIDTMIFVRALINPYGFNARLLNRVDEYELSLSEEIIEEVVEVLFRPEIQKKYNPSKVITVHDVLEIISDADLITPSQKINLCRDPKDNKFIECAVEAEADYLISGDKDLLDIGEYEEIKIITIDKFMEVLDKEREIRGDKK